MNYNNLQPTDAITVSEISASSTSSNIVAVYGTFTVQIPDGNLAIADAGQSISAYVSNANMLTGTAPVGGHGGDYSDNPGFLSSFTCVGTLASSTGVQGGAIFNYTKPVRWLYLVAPSLSAGGASAGLRSFTKNAAAAQIGDSLTGYVYKSQF